MGALLWVKSHREGDLISGGLSHSRRPTSPSLSFLENTGAQSREGSPQH